MRLIGSEAVAMAGPMPGPVLPELAVPVLVLRLRPGYDHGFKSDESQANPLQYGTKTENNFFVNTGTQ
jgi:hypothetical protein